MFISKNGSFIKLVLLFCLFITTKSYSQIFTITGNISDQKTGNSLSFANLRVCSNNLGTAADTEGNFELKLSAGNYKIIFSYIGYVSDTTEVELSDNASLKIQLKPTALDFQEIYVTPGINPAVEVIKKAISYKERRKKSLKNYEFNSYSKMVFKSNREMEGQNNEISLGAENSSDSSEISIRAIIESYSKTKFREPNVLKEEIIARKQTANLPATVNMLTGGRLIQNFYEDDIQFFNMKIPSPVSEDGADYYYYFLQDSTMMDGEKIYRLYFAPVDSRDPGFYGNLFIVDKLFAIVKLDVNLNKAANPYRIFNNINVFQQFMKVSDSTFFPIDYRLFADGSLLGMFDFGVEVNSLLYNYSVNQADSEKVNPAIITVLPDADEKNNEFWSRIQSLPLTQEENAAYIKIDSTASVPKTFFERLNIFGDEIEISENYSIKGILGMYHFNRVEGHSLNTGLKIKNEFNKRFNSQFSIGYGFSDKRVKTKLNASYLFGKYRTTKLSFEIGNPLNELFDCNGNYTKFTSTITNLFFKTDEKNYYYSAGGKISFETEITDYLKLSSGFSASRDRSAYVNTNYSFFKKDKIYPENRKVVDTEINLFELGLNLDFNDFYEDGYFRKKIGNSITPIFNINYITGKPAFLKNEFQFEQYVFSAEGRLPVYRAANLMYRIKHSTSSGIIPIQNMFAIAGNISSGAKDYSFRTLRIGEVFGDELTVINLNQDLQSELFKVIGLGFMDDLQISLNVFFNAAYSKISHKSKKILEGNFTEFRKPFFEAGFGVGHSLFPVKFEFGWKLNHRGINNFVIGINSELL